MLCTRTCRAACVVDCIGRSEIGRIQPAWQPAGGLGNDFARSKRNAHRIAWITLRSTDIPRDKGHSALWSDIVKLRRVELVVIWYLSKLGRNQSRDFTITIGPGRHLHIVCAFVSVSFAPHPCRPGSMHAATLRRRNQRLENIMAKTSAEEQARAANGKSNGASNGNGESKSNQVQVDGHAAIPTRPLPTSRGGASSRVRIALTVFALCLLVFYQRNQKKTGGTALPETYAICSREGEARVYTAEINETSGEGGVVQCVVVRGKRVADLGSLGGSLLPGLQGQTGDAEHIAGRPNRAHSVHVGREGPDGPDSPLAMGRAQDRCRHLLPGEGGGTDARESEHHQVSSTS